MPYYVYILSCEDGALYTGYTKNVKARMRLHQLGRGAKYLKTHSPDKIVYLEEFETRSTAMKREREIKKLTRLQKLRLTAKSRARKKSNVS
jgi:putative endonuclease